MVKSILGRKGIVYLTLLHNSPSLSKGREGFQARYRVAVIEAETMETFVLSLHSTLEQPPYTVLPV